MEFDDIERILELVKQHDLAEFELERDGLKLRIRKTGGDAPAPSSRPAAAAGGAPSAPLPPGPHAAGLHAARRRRRRRPRAGGREVADRRHLLSVARSLARRRSSRSGDRVKKDQVLCIIEAMKLMNEITSEYDGEIVSAYVENGKPVQYGERLFAIKTT